jgi:hypothetical protein
VLVQVRRTVQEHYCAAVHDPLPPFAAAIAVA